MSFSAGVYTLPGAALNTGDTVSATENNTLRNDMASSFNLTWLRNGTAAATANIPMGGYKITGLAAGTTSGDAVRYDEFSAFAANTFGFKNRIINGAMVIDQRNAGASVTINSNQYTIDRYQAIQTQTGKYSVQQSTTVPTGFKNSMLITSASAYSITSSDTFYFRQSIEGYNVSDLAFGTASAATVTLSFWVRSSLTGTFGGALKNDAGNRSYPFSYTISAANTWEQKSITIAGDQSGTWDTGTARGLQVIFGLGVGSTFSTTAGSWVAGDYSSVTSATSVVGTNGATFYITGVQLEKGSTATSFDYRPYGTELMLCQRYLPAFPAASGVILGTGYFDTNAGIYYLNFPVTPRVPATGMISSSASSFYANNPGVGNPVPTGIAFVSSSNTSMRITATGIGTVTNGMSSALIANTTVLIYGTGCEL